MPLSHRKYSNQQRDHVYISPNKKVAYCKVPKVGTNSWGGFFARAGIFKKSHFHGRPMDRVLRTH